jgi:phage terminase small subunit
MSERRVATFPGARARPPERPDWLRGVGAEIWGEITPAMLRAGLLDELTATACAHFCQVSADVRRLHTLVNQTGMARAIETGLFGALVETEKLFLRFASSFFCTPSSRGQGPGAGA